MTFWVTQFHSTNKVVLYYYKAELLAELSDACYFNVCIVR
jgi:hypothetical protein